jgi:MGT family glycosyltransferase
VGILRTWYFIGFLNLYFWKKYKVQQMAHTLNGKKILIANVPTDGHFNPLTGLAKSLQDSGCDVRWYASIIYAEKLKRLGIMQYPFVRAKELNGNTLALKIPEITSATGTEKGKLYLKHLFIERAPEYVEDIREIYQTFPFDVLIADSMFSAIPLVRHYLKVPVVAIGVVPLVEDSMDTAPAGRALPPAESNETRIAYADMYRQKYIGIKELIRLYKALLQRYQVKVTGSFIFDTLVKEASIYLQIGLPDFEYKRTDLSKNIRYVGALLPQSTKENPAKWFDERLEQYDKVVLATQGTMEGDVTKLLEPTLNAFAGTDILLIITTGGRGTRSLRERYPQDNVIIEDFISFDDIMPHVSVYITNGGYGGTMLSITYGVPIVAAGVHELKNEVCARIDYFGLGIDLKTERPDADEIFFAAQNVIEDRVFKQRVMEMREKLKKYDSIDLCLFYISALLND